MTTVSPVQVLVCTTCRKSGSEGPASNPLDMRPGATLLARLADAGLPEGVEVRAVECLSNCSHGCTIAVRGPDRWTYIYGNLDPDTHLDIVRDGLARYAATEDGLVPWRERPEHFRKNCIARLPPLETPNA